MTGLLHIEGLSVEGRGPSGEWLPIVKDADVRIKRGEIVALIGESGAGKTTVALSAMGYWRPGTRLHKGRVLLDNTDLLSLTPEELRGVRGRRVAYVAQSASATFNPKIPLGDQILEGLSVHGMGGTSAGRERMRKLMRLMQLPDPEGLATRYPYQVSGGQRQRIMVAMAMICAPEYLILDEPTTALDVTTQIEVLRTVADAIHEEGAGAIYVSHDLAVVSQVADHIIVMKDGSIVESARAEDILSAPREDYTKKLMGAVRVIPAVSNGAAGPPVAAVSEAGSGSGSGTGSDTGSGGGPLVALRNVDASYRRGSAFRPVRPENYVLRSVDLSVDPGEIVALVGESGSGKSTIARVLTGLLAPLSGAIEYRSKPLAPGIRGRGIDRLRNIQIVFQNPDMTLNPAKRIEDEIGRPLDLYFSLTGPRRRGRIEELLDLVGLPVSYAERYPGELSGGEKQRVAIARALAAEPELIICDEVLSSLDNLVAARILDLLKDLKARLSVAYLFISHDLATVAEIADRVVVMYAGRVCEAGTVDRVFSPPYHPYTSLLISSVPQLRRDWLSGVLEARGALEGLNELAVPIDEGCAFRSRCPLAIEDLCERQAPPLRELGGAGGHVAYCHRPAEDLVKV